MVINVLRKAREIVLENKNPKEFRIAKLHRYIPRQCDRQIKDDAWDPQCPPKAAPVTPYRDESNNKEQNDNHRRQRRSNRPLGQSSQRQKNIKRGQVDTPLALVPRIPREQR